MPANPEPGEHSGQSLDTWPSRSPCSSFLQLTSLRQETVMVTVVAQGHTTGYGFFALLCTIPSLFGT